MTCITELAQRMRTVAEKATSGQWERGDGKHGGKLLVYCDDAVGSAVCEATSGYNAITKYQRIDNLDFIALANPANVIALVEALEKAQRRNAELEAQNEYIRKRYQQLDLLIGKNILVMQAAIIEWQATGDAKNGLVWIYNTLFGPGELPDEAEKDAQAYFDRKYAPLDEELMALHKWFWEQSEAERAAAGIKVEAE